MTENPSLALPAQDKSLRGRARALYARIRRHPLAFLFWAFLIPFALTALMYYFKGTFPFGDGSVLVLDLNGQYVYFYEEMQDIYRFQSSPFYSWERELGGEFIGNIAYYVASPFVFLVTLFPKGYILDAIFFVFLCKAGACGVTMAYYLYRRYPTKDKTAILIFSTLYATCAYAVVQGHNSMWVDELIWLPLLVLGIEELIYRKKGILCSVMLALSLLSNFYIGYMMCLFCVFYFFYAYFVRRDNNFYGESYHFLRALGRMILYCAIGIAIAATIILPTYYSLQFGKTDFTNPSYKLFQNYDFLDMLAKLYPGSFDTVRPEGLPFLYGGTITLLLLPFFFVCRRVAVREKIAGAAAIAFFLASFNLSTVDLVWHGFQFPNWLNHRYSFMLTFFLVLFAYRAFCELERIRYHHLLAVGAIEVLLLLVIQKTSELYNDYALVWGGLICFTLLLIALWIFKNKARIVVAKHVLCFFLAAESVFIGLLHLCLLDMDVGFTSRSNYMNFQERLTPIVEKIQAQDDSFYRMEKTMHRMKNDSLQFNMRGVSHSTSTLNAATLTFLNRMGLTAVSNWSSYAGGNPATDSLLGIKYIITPTPIENGLYEEYFYDEQGALYAYKNPYALSVVSAVNPAFGKMQWTDAEQKDYNQNEDNYPSSLVLLNEMLAAMSGTSLSDLDYFERINYTLNTDNCYKNNGFLGHYCIQPNDSGRCEVSFEFTAKNTDPVYFFVPIYVGYRREATIEVTCNGEPIKLDTTDFFTEDSDRIISLGSFQVDDEICVKLTPKNGEMFFPTGERFFYSLDMEAFVQTMTSLQASQMNITEYSDTRLFGTISVPADRTMLYTSIPYDENWHVYVDGQEVPIYKSADALVAADIAAGEHEIELRYIPKQFYLGLGIAIFGVAALVGMGFYESYQTKKRKRAWAQKAIVYPLEQK